MSLVAKRSVTLSGHKTGVTLEDKFWNALRKIALYDKTTVASLVGRINLKQEQSILRDRAFVLKRSAMAADQEKQEPIVSINAAA